MDVINGTLQKGETPRKKRVKNVQIEEVQTQKGKDIQKSIEVPRKVTFKKIPLPIELNQQIVADEDITYAGKSKKHSSKKIWMRVILFLIKKFFIRYSSFKM